MNFPERRSWPLSGLPTTRTERQGSKPAGAVESDKRCTNGRSLARSAPLSWARKTPASATVGAQQRRCAIAQLQGPVALACFQEPWVSEKKILKLVPKGENQDLFCFPTEEQRFNELVRDPGSGIVKK